MIDASPRDHEDTLKRPVLASRYCFRAWTQIKDDKCIRCRCGVPHFRYRGLPAYVYDGGPYGSILGTNVSQKPHIRSVDVECYRMIYIIRYECEIGTCFTIATPAVIISFGISCPSSSKSLVEVVTGGIASAVSRAALPMIPMATGRAFAAGANFPPRICSL